MIKYYIIDLHLGSEWEVSEKEFNRKIKSKNFVPVWDSYYQEHSKTTWYDIRDSICRIFYQKREVADDLEG